MLIFILAYLGGVLTIMSPCILPVLPFVFTRASQPFHRGGLPLLAGMAITFAAIATLAAIGGGWAIEANRYGRTGALLLLAVFGISLIFPGLSERLTRPLVALGARLTRTAEGHEKQASIGSSMLLGVATGLLWAPCAGPILGLLLTGAALQGANLGTSFLLFAYAAGAATSLAAALLIGGRLFLAMKKSIGAGNWLRRIAGVAVLASIAAISLHLDTDFLTRLSLANTNPLEQILVDRFRPAAPVVDTASAMTPDPRLAMALTGSQAGTLPVEGLLPPLSGAVTWLNSKPLTAEALRGHVVLIDFWTYSCINCLRALPYVEAWSQKYRQQGLIVIGVHAPEFAFERDIGNVRQAIQRLHIDYPVAIDNDYAIWRAFNNQYWPAHYFIDAQGRIRHHHFGEGNYAESEKIIQQLLRDSGHQDTAAGTVQVAGEGVQQMADVTGIQSPETYIGTDRSEHFASPGGAMKDIELNYKTPDTLTLNQWALSGLWRVGGQNATLRQPGGSISFRFHARDLHLVLGPAMDGHPVRYQVLLDGHAPGSDHGTDTDAEGNGTITGQRLYQLIRQQRNTADHTFEIRFPDAGATAYAFTFG